MRNDRGARLGYCRFYLAGTLFNSSEQVNRSLLLGDLRNASTSFGLAVIVAPLSRLWPTSPFRFPLAMTALTFWTLRMHIIHKVKIHPQRDPPGRMIL